MVIAIDQDGHLDFVWNDELVGLTKLGSTTIERASHVEPVMTGENAGKWMADMGPVGGPTLGPFDLRGEAIDAELAWISNNLGL